MAALAPLGLRAKSHDHELVRVQKKASKDCLRHLQNHVVWSRILKYSVTQASTKCYSNEFRFMRVFIHVKME